MAKYLLNVGLVILIYHPAASLGSLFNEEEIDIIVSQHNEYRAAEGASNMLEMKWDVHLAAWAQQWANRCQFVYGQPEGDTIPTMGQNVFLTSAVSLAVKDPAYAWYSQKSHYHFETHTCRGEYSCEPYKQVVWAHTNALGCGYSSCHNGIMVVCYYSPRGNIEEERPYRRDRGEPCTQCDSGSGWCREGFCDDTCTSSDEHCYCNARCKNCGTLDLGTCRCHCAPGWYGVDCSLRCVDGSSRCGGYPNPWPRELCDNPENQQIRHLCPAYCGICEGRVELPECDDPEGLSIWLQLDDFRCTKWGDWDNSSCQSCGGCGYKIRYRECDFSADSMRSSCEPVHCVKGLHSRREIFYKRHPFDGRLRRLARNRRCCYDFRNNEPRKLPRPKICPSVWGWTQE